MIDLHELTIESNGFVLNGQNITCEEFIEYLVVNGKTVNIDHKNTYLYSFDGKVGKVLKGATVISVQ